jgi:hypothetical protein
MVDQEELDRRVLDGIRKILNEPQNWKYAKQSTAHELEILRRYNEHPAPVDLRSIIASMIENQELSANIFHAFQKVHWDYDLNNVASVQLLEQACQKRGLPTTVKNIELIFEETKHQLPLSQEGRDAERVKQVEQAEAQRQKVAAAHQAQETDRMVNDITGYMLDGNGKLKREYLQREYNNKIAGLRAMPFSELVARYETVMAARAQRKAPVEELRAVVQLDAAHKRQSLYQRYEQIPDLYFPPGKSEGLRWTFDLFRRLPSMEQRRLLDHFGNDQLTAACAAKGN